MRLNTYIPIKVPALGALLAITIIQCAPGEEELPLFEKLSPEQTGITFENTIRETEDFSYREFPFIFNGGGVAIGDINNNGYPDILFTGNMVSSRLYLNRGEFTFEDITEQAGITTLQWVTGASMVDISNNGFLDIYLSVMGPSDSDPDSRRNLLFLNNGDETFTEAAAEFGIDDPGFTTHAAFFDYNGSGHLDLYLLNNSPGSFARAREVRVAAEQMPLDPWGFDKLYRNNGDGTFTDVSDEAGILQQTGYGLGIAITDFNRNGLPDIYISNDITPNDVLYINNGDGTYTDRASGFLKQTSYAGMGIDAADFTNNGWPDLMQTDMMPEAMAHQKQLSGGFGYHRFKAQREMGLDVYYSKNALQMNRGTDAGGEIHFSEIARMAGVAYTDWSWAALFADLNNSGYKDLLVTNGYPKAMNNFDYLQTAASATQFGTQETIRQRQEELYADLHGIEVPNYFYRNNGTLVFEDVSHEWGFREPGLSYGTAVADLNNNGSLDIVINNLNAPAGIYKNRAFDLLQNNYLQVKLEGRAPNRRGLGAELTLHTAGDVQYIYHSVHRGYKSTIDDRIQFGLGRYESADSLSIRWSDGSVQVVREIAANQLITLSQEDAKLGPSSDRNRNNASETIFTEKEGLLSHIHTQPNVVDFDIQPLLPYKMSRIGPAIAVADITGNGLDDIFVGGEAGEPGTIYLQQQDGRFRQLEQDQFLHADRHFTDTGALFFDANGNGLPDLYVASGGYQISAASDALQDRLYINRGDGRFIRDDGVLPGMLSNTSVIAAADFTGNGYNDLFVGGSMIPGNYPQPARSFLLLNNGGRFSDGTESIAPELAETGIFTGAVWADYNGNGRPDLIATGKWMPIQIYENEEGILRNKTEEAGLAQTAGWWYSLAVDDLTGNGYPDIAAGNLGGNHSFAYLQHRKPIGLYAHDFNRDQHTDLVYTYEKNGEKFPYFGLAKLGPPFQRQADRFRSFQAFTEASVIDIFGSHVLEQAAFLTVDTFASSLFLNDGEGRFRTLELPEMAQISSVKAILSGDFTGEGSRDLLLAGNIYESDPDLPRLDAGKGLLLKRGGNGAYQPVPIQKSGFITPGDVRGMAVIRTVNGKAVLAVNNAGPVQIFYLHYVDRGWPLQNGTLW